MVGNLRPGLLIQGTRIWHLVEIIMIDRGRQTQRTSAVWQHISWCKADRQTDSSYRMVHRVIRMVVTWRLNRIRCVWWSSFFILLFFVISSRHPCQHEIMSVDSHEKNLFFFTWIIGEEINNDFPLLWTLVIKRINKKDFDLQLYSFLYCKEKIPLIDRTIFVILRGTHKHNIWILFIT